MIYALEPIVPINPDSHGAQARWWELLFRGGRRRPTGQWSVTPAEWRDWYGVLPGIVHAILLQHSDLRLSINVSTLQLLDVQIRESLWRLAQIGTQLAVEWVEDPLVSGPIPGKHAAADLLCEMRSRFGVFLGIDDVGAGDDGMGRSILLDAPPDFVKLDGSVLHALQVRPLNRELLKQQIWALRRLDIWVVGEHVESVEQLQLAQALGLSHVQGFLFTHNHLASTRQSEVQDRQVADSTKVATATSEGLARDTRDLTSSEGLPVANTHFS